MTYTTVTTGVSSVVKDNGHLFIEKKNKKNKTIIIINEINVFRVSYAYDSGGGR